MGKWTATKLSLKKKNKKIKKLSLYSEINEKLKKKNVLKQNHQNGQIFNFGKILQLLYSYLKEMKTKKDRTGKKQYFKYTCKKSAQTNIVEPKIYKIEKTTT